METVRFAGFRCPSPSAQHPRQEIYLQPRQYATFTLHDNASSIYTSRSPSNVPPFATYPHLTPHIGPQFPVWIRGAASTTPICIPDHDSRYSSFSSGISQGTLEQLPQHLLQNTKAYPDFIDPFLSETFEQPNLGKGSPPQDSLDIEVPDSPTDPAKPEPRAEKPTRSSKAFLPLPGYAGQENGYGYFDCFEDCDRRRYQERGFSRRSNLLAHLRSCHRQDIPRNDHVRDQRKNRR